MKCFRAEKYKLVHNSTCWVLVSWTCFVWHATSCGPETSRVTPHRGSNNQQRNDVFLFLFFSIYLWWLNLVTLDRGVQWRDCDWLRSLLIVNFDEWNFYVSVDNSSHRFCLLLLFSLSLSRLSHYYNQWNIRYLIDFVWFDFDLFIPKQRRINCIGSCNEDERDGTRWERWRLREMGEQRKKQRKWKCKGFRVNDSLRSFEISLDILVLSPRSRIKQNQTKNQTKKANNQCMHAFIHSLIECQRKIFKTPLAPP